LTLQTIPGNIEIDPTAIIQITIDSSSTTTSRTIIDVIGCVNITGGSLNITLNSSNLKNGNSGTRLDIIQSESNCLNGKFDSVILKIEYSDGRICSISNITGNQETTKSKLSLLVPSSIIQSSKCTNNNQNNGLSSKLKIIIGIVIGVVILILVILMIIIGIYWKDIRRFLRKKRKIESEQTEDQMGFRLQTKLN